MRRTKIEQMGYYGGQAQEVDFVCRVGLLLAVQVGGLHRLEV